MKAGIIGYPYAGKTTLFHAVAGREAKGEVASVPVNDERFEKLCDAVQPKKRTPATVEIWDNAVRLSEPGTDKKSSFTDSARRMDVFVHVIREFESSSVPFFAPPDIKRDYQTVDTDLLVSDLQITENRLERLSKSNEARSPGSKEYVEKTALEKIKSHLENGTPVRNITFDESELNSLTSYQFLSAKKIITVINCSEQNMRSVTDFENELNAKGEEVFRICAEIEKDLASMQDSEREEFLKDLNINEPVSKKLIRSVYNALGLITFFTAGQNETKAWPLRKGDNALKAASVIHTDIAKGFVRAEVTHYRDFEELGSMKLCYDQNRMKLQGKEYIVQDGDIINVRSKI